MSQKSRKPSNENTTAEPRILQRGGYYLTPFTLDHIDEVEKHLSKENRRELKLLGHVDVREALIEMYQCSECYLCRKEGESFIMIGGLWFDGDQDFPQMFAMFSDKIKDNFHAMARGSQMFVKHFDQWHSHMSMTVLADYEFVLDWASWLGFEAVGVMANGPNKYVEFVRCNPSEKYVSHETSRPVMH